MKKLIDMKYFKMLLVFARKRRPTGAKLRALDLPFRIPKRICDETTIFRTDFGFWLVFCWLREWAPSNTILIRSPNEPLLPDDSLDRRKHNGADP